MILLARNQVVPIGGPRAVSWREIVGAVGDTLGQKLPVQWVAPREPLPLLAPEKWALASCQGPYAQMDGWGGRRPTSPPTYTWLRSISSWGRGWT